MNTNSSRANAGAAQAITVTRVNQTHWRATAENLVVGQADASERPDGRTFISVDAWTDAAFDQLADRMLTDLDGPLYTLVDDTDPALLAKWQQHGLQPRRREREYRLPSSGDAVGAALASPPAGVTLVTFGMADETRLRGLDRDIRREVEAASGWSSMPAEVLPRPNGRTVIDPSRYAVATRDGRYIGLVRVTGRPQQPRIGLLAVRADEQRSGVGRILLALALHAVHERRVDAVCTEVDETNTIAIKLLEKFGAQHTGTASELERSR